LDSTVSRPASTHLPLSMSIHGKTFSPCVSSWCIAGLLVIDFGGQHSLAFTDDHLST
jgi:hypothetical protein